MKRLNHFQVRDVNEKLPIPLDDDVDGHLFHGEHHADLHPDAVRSSRAETPFHKLKNIIKPIQYY